MRTAYTTRNVDLTATPSEILGSNPRRVGVIWPIPPSGTRINMSPLNVVSNTLYSFAITEYTSEPHWFREQFGEAITQRIFAVSNTDITVLVTEVIAVD